MSKIENFLNKKHQEKIICLTAYSYPFAKILDEFCDVILVGDSLGMVVYGFEDTVDVTLDLMINHGRAVVKAAKKALIVVDLPHGTYENSKEQALESAQQVMRETGCDAIKIETSRGLVETVRFLADNGINVMGHVGLLPQSVREIGGYKYQGKTMSQAEEILQTSILLEKAGAFSLVIEAVPEVLAMKISNALTIPTIGIGASAECDGQVLVIDDLLALNKSFKPRFVTYYADLEGDIKSAVKAFSCDVKTKKFPAADNLFDV